MRHLAPGNRSAVTAGIFTLLRAPFNLQPMKLNALVMSRSHSSIRVLVAAFAELGIEYRISPSASETMETLATDHHSALIVDFDLPHSVQIAHAARVTSTRRPVIFGMIGAGTSIESACLLKISPNPSHQES